VRAELEPVAFAILRRPPDPPELTDEEGDRLQEEHLAFLQSLRDGGILAASGPFSDQWDESWRGLCLLRVPVDEARRLLADDPLVAQGRVVADVLTWNARKGDIAWLSRRRYVRLSASATPKPCGCRTVGADLRQTGTSFVVRLTPWARGGGALPTLDARFCERGTTITDQVRLPHEVFVFVRRADEFLVLHRSPKQGAYWHCVAGALEAGETCAEAAARELREETGLEAELVDLGRRYEYELEEWEPRYTRGADRITVECFLAEAPAGWEPRLDWEHDDYRWCETEEATELLFWPEPREVLEELARR